MVVTHRHPYAQGWPSRRSRNVLLLRRPGATRYNSWLVATSSLHAARHMPGRYGLPHGQTVLSWLPILNGGPSLQDLSRRALQPNFQRSPQRAALGLMFAILISDTYPGYYVAVQVSADGRRLSMKTPSSSLRRTVSRWGACVDGHRRVRIGKRG
ncbi:hypothetical protein GSI_07239 [Ganoderma sinense ZZ0214-1]|uniref:Uncharacterized protein n=1 Tax=Ganoderma sinense ZZ0214-1 TaxID=1077348 RepID=A0A2G8S9U5_9APHY|nr:hypothetical protein GSI_07239 [Ganoderma sinense ZZ0214-1]